MTIRNLIKITMYNLKDEFINESEKQPSIPFSNIDRITTVYLMDIDNEATVVIAANIAEAMTKAEKVAKKDYKMVYSKSLPLLY